MSKFSTEVRASTSLAEIMRSGHAILEEMGLIFEDRGIDHLQFKEKLRFDPFNPVEIEIRVRRNGEDFTIELEGSNIGTGPYQETHVKKMIFELVDRLEETLPKRDLTLDCSDPGIAQELELLSRLHSDGVLSDVEYRRAKDKLLK